MSLINTQTKLSDILINEPTTIPVLNRFGITMGVGDKNVEQVCKEKNLDAHFFTTILNTYINHEYFPEKILNTFNPETIISYLKKTNSYYQQFQLPNIERHLNFLLERSDTTNGNLPLIKNFFIEVKTELLSRIKHDNELWFPAILNYKKGAANKLEVEPFNDIIDDKLQDLISMFVIHLKGEYDQNLTHAVLVSLFALKVDMEQNNRIRNRILIPLCNAMTNS